jgi:hypothetical protein
MLTSESRRIVELAARTRLPAIYPFRSDAENGGLMSYGTDLAAVFRGAATYIDISKCVGRVKRERALSLADRWSLAIRSSR